MLNVDDQDLSFLLIDIKTIFTAINEDVNLVENTLKQRLEIQEDGISCKMSKEQFVKTMTELEIELKHGQQPFQVRDLTSRDGDDINDKDIKIGLNDAKSLDTPVDQK